MKKTTPFQRFHAWLRENIFLLKTDIINEWTIQRYLRSTTPSFLHIKCGERIIPGALNGDIYTGDIYLNTSEDLSFENNVFDKIYTFHSIEYMEEEERIRFFQECYRILKPGGWMRIVTLDLRKIATLYINNDKIDCEHMNRVMKGDDEKRTFIFDQESIKKLLVSIGFRDIVFQHNYNSSEIFKDIDPKGNELTTQTQICVEIRK